MRDIIKNYFVAIKGIYRGTLEIKEAKWFNGRTFYPLYTYSIRSEKLLLEYSLQSNEYSTSNALLPSKSDIHKVQISYSFPSQLDDKLTISARYNLFTLILKGKNDYRVISNNIVLRNYLKKDESIYSIFSDFLDPEFSPIITGETRNNKYIINIRFNLVRFNPDIFSLIDKFTINFENKYRNPKMN